jgi:guanylate kinase
MRAESGSLMVVSGPSGAGKSTVIARLMHLRKDVAFSVSCTTRTPREGESDGVNYRFIDRAAFEEMIEGGAFLEHAEYVGNLYGTPREPVLDKLAAGVSVVLDIEVQGAAQVKAAMPEAIMVFLAPPSLLELERRLRHRGTDSDARIRRRLETARSEYQRAPSYDYIVINDDPDVAGEELSAILTAEKCRVSRRTIWMNEVFST